VIQNIALRFCVGITLIPMALLGERFLLMATVTTEFEPLTFTYGVLVLGDDQHSVHLARLRMRRYLDRYHLRTLLAALKGDQIIHDFSV
jgi:hypothetical protein